MASTPGNSSHPARDAWRRGWITRQQMEDCMSGGAAKQISPLDALRESGLIDANKLARLLGAEALPDEMIEEGIHEEEPLRAGDIIGGRFRIFGIAEGGFGRVFFCLHDETGERYALKTLRRHHLREPVLMRHFRAEAKRWVELGVHPHLVRAHGVEEHGSLLFLVLEYIEGGRTLADDIVAGSSDWRSTLRVACGLADALLYADRSTGLVHGDIKPLNILLMPDGSAKLTDFGISYARLSEPDENALAGTPGYIAPELLEERPRCAATDIFAFGRTLWQSATGRLPLPIDPRVPVQDVRAISPQTPAPLARIIMDCMHANPAKRPSSLAALCAELNALHLRLLGEPFQPGKAPPTELTGTEEAARYAANLSDSAISLGNHRQALELARRAIEIDPAYWRGHDALGRAFLALDRYSDAEAVFLTAIRMQPEDPSLRGLLATAQFRRGNHAAAHDSLLKALDLAKTHSKSGELDTVSWLIIELLPPESALAWLDEIVISSPQASRSWVNRTALLRILQRPDDALACARQAVNLNPASSYAWAALAGALFDADFGDGALAAIDRAIGCDDTQPSFYAQKCVILASLGQENEAQSLFKTAIGKWPGSPELLALT